MKTIYKSLVITICLLTAFSGNAQTKENDLQKRQRVEKNTPAFSLDFFSSDKNTFYVLEVSVKDNEIVFDETAKIQEVAGKPSFSVGDMRVTLLDKQGKQITEYYIQDPLDIYSCDGEDDNVSSLKNGRIFINIPKRDNIGQIILSKDNRKYGTFNLEKMIKR